MAYNKVMVRKRITPALSDIFPPDHGPSAVHRAFVYDHDMVKNYRQSAFADDASVGNPVNLLVIHDPNNSKKLIEFEYTHCAVISPLASDDEVRGKLLWGNGDIVWRGSEDDIFYYGPGRSYKFDKSRTIEP